VPPLLGVQLLVVDLEDDPEEEGVHMGRINICMKIWVP
jgi:hypothetical protein